jgi:hypothetical protein
LRHVFVLVLHADVVVRSNSHSPTPFDPLSHSSSGNSAHTASNITANPNRSLSRVQSAEHSEDEAKATGASRKLDNLNDVWNDEMKRDEMRCFGFVRCCFGWGFFWFCFCLAIPGFYFIYLVVFIVHVQHERSHILN